MPTPADTWSPVVILTGREEGFSTFANFSKSVCASGVKRGHMPMHWGGNDLGMTWQSKSFCFHANYPDATGKCHADYQAPSDTGDHGKGRNMSVAPQYQGPHLNGALLPDTITLSWKNYVLDYVFADGADKIAPRVA